MTFHKVYSTAFIIQDLADYYFSGPSNQRRLYSKLVDGLKEGFIQIAVENKGLSKLEKLEMNKDEDALERVKFELLESLLSSGRIKFSSDESTISDCLNSITMRTTYKRKFSPAADEHISTAFYDSLPESSIKEKIGKGLKKALIDKSQIDNGSIEYIFKTNELAPIKKGDYFKWYTYLKPFGIHTNRVLIRDPYFYKNSLGNGLNSLIGPLLYASYSTPIQVEIISALDGSIRKDDAIKNVRKWVDEQDSRLNITCYYQKGSASALFHDRYLFTDYWALKVPAGLDVEKNEKASSYTIPTLVGRYDPKGSTWKYINKNWDNWKNKKCKSINIQK